MVLVTWKMNRVPQIILIILFVFILIAPNPVYAQGASIVGEVVDESSNEPIVDATVTVSYSENGTVVAITKTDSTGYYQVTDISSDVYLVTIEAEGYRNYTQVLDVGGSPIFGEDTYVVNGHLDPLLQTGDGKSESDRLPIYVFLQIGLIITVVLAVSLVMYSKIKRENLLKNTLRKRIFDYIKDHPGLHYRAILTDLELPMGVLTYHLNRLEKAQYIKSKQDGMFRRFYVAGRKTEMRFFLTDIQQSILNVIKDNRGISQSKIAEKISVSRKVVNYHINILNQAGLIFVESHGRETACYPIEPMTQEGKII